MDDMIQEKVAQKANELHATYDERIRNYEERYAFHCDFHIPPLLTLLNPGNKTSRNKLLYPKPSSEIYVHPTTPTRPS